jgi:PAS domain S-box-containing protein
MGQDRKPPKGTRDLQERAEAGRQSKAPAFQELSRDEMSALVQELQVQQVELARQHEALRRTHTSLEEASKKYRDFYDGAPVGFVTLNESGLIREVNRTAVSQLGVARGSLINKPFPSFIKAEDQDRFHLCLKRVFQEPGPQHCEIKLARRDGGYFVARLDSVAVTDVSGARVCRTSISDISDLKQAERKLHDIAEAKEVREALRESEAKFRASFDQAPIGAAIVSLDYRFQRVNDELCRLTGYSAAELTCRTFLDITHPEDMAESIKRGGRLAREEIEQYQVDKRYIRKDGEVVWVRLSVRLVKDAQGAPRYFLGMMEDITERRRGKEALKESENQYRLLVKQIPAVVFKGYADWSIDFFDQKIESLTGYRKEEFDSRRLQWCDLILPEDLDKAQGIFVEALKAGQSYVREYRIRKKDGEIAWIQARGQIFCDAASQVDYVSGCFRHHRAQGGGNHNPQRAPAFFLLTCRPRSVWWRRTLPCGSPTAIREIRDLEGRTCELIRRPPVR